MDAGSAERGLQRGDRRLQGADFGLNIRAVGVLRGRVFLQAVQTGLQDIPVLLQGFLVEQGGGQMTAEEAEAGLQVLHLAVQGVDGGAGVRQLQFEGFRLFLFGGEQFLGLLALQGGFFQVGGHLRGLLVGGQGVQAGGQFLGFAGLFGQLLFEAVRVCVKLFVFFGQLGQQGVALQLLGFGRLLGGEGGGELFLGLLQLGGEAAVFFGDSFALLGDFLGIELFLGV